MMVDLEFCNLYGLKSSACYISGDDPSMISIFVSNILFGFVLLVGWSDVWILPNSSFGIAAWLCSQGLNGVLGSNPSWPHVRNLSYPLLFSVHKALTFDCQIYYHQEDIFTGYFYVFSFQKEVNLIHCSKRRFRKNYRIQEALGLHI